MLIFIPDSETEEVTRNTQLQHTAPPKRLPDVFRSFPALILEGVVALLAALGRVLDPLGIFLGSDRSPEAYLVCSWVPLECLVALLNQI